MVLTNLRVLETGKHRYVFLLYRHGSDTKDITGPKERKNWGTGKPRHGARQWAKGHDLTLVGMLARGNYRGVSNVATKGPTFSSPSTVSSGLILKL